jgi:hypothetical protein
MMNLTMDFTGSGRFGWFFIGRFKINRVLAEHRYIGQNGLSKKEKEVD